LNDPSSATIWWFAVSSTVARVPLRWREGMGWSGLLAIGVAAVGFSDSTPFPGYAALLPTFGAALVIGAGIADGSPRVAVARLLELAPMRFVGDRRSYASTCATGRC
jgi:peptidoglycan/LPS O-acetylase OafA/YrhL